MSVNQASIRTRLAVRNAMGITLTVGLLALLPLKAAHAQSCVAWSDTNTTYTSGEVVTYSGSTYTATQTFTNAAGAGWEPPNVPALWTPGGSCSSPGPTPTPTPTPPPTPTAP
ncbi:MAG: hypothetical protein M0038_04425, partial [Pseudomonadota bacterium]|nr:hypothetical protein [Pseudomonadota bacterium]